MSFYVIASDAVSFHMIALLLLPSVYKISSDAVFLHLTTLLQTLHGITSHAVTLLYFILRDYFRYSYLA